MILSDREIQAALRRGAITITPPPPDLWAEPPPRQKSPWSSPTLDLRLDKELTIWKRKSARSKRTPSKPGIQRLEVPVMSLACKKCGSRETFICGARDLAAKTSDQSFVTCTSGAIIPRLLLPLLGSPLAAGKALFEYLGCREKNNPPVIVCKACGSWERVST
jgi:hypothetical protein